MVSASSPSAPIISANVSSSSAIGTAGGSSALVSSSRPDQVTMRCCSAAITASRRSWRSSALRLWSPTIS